MTAPTADIPGDRAAHGVARRRVSTPVRGSARPGYTLLDMLFVLIVVGLLGALMLPALASVRDATRRVACGSNLRQLGLCIELYTQDHDGRLPSFGVRGFSGRGVAQLTAWLAYRGQSGRQWTGLGLLHGEGYMDAPETYFCPSQPGSLTFETMAGRFAGEPGTVVGNYQYRTHPDNHGYGTASDRLSHYRDDALLLADTLGYREFNHEDGFNVLTAGMSVAWVADESESMPGLVESRELVAKAGRGLSAWRVIEAWDELEAASSNRR